MKKNKNGLQLFNKTKKYILTFVLTAVPAVKLPEVSSGLISLLRSVCDR